MDSHVEYYVHDEQEFDDGKSWMLIEFVTHKDFWAYCNLPSYRYGLEEVFNEKQQSRLFSPKLKWVMGRRGDHGLPWVDE